VIFSSFRMVENNVEILVNLFRYQVNSNMEHRYFLYLYSEVENCVCTVTTVQHEAAPRHLSHVGLWVDKTSRKNLAMQS
jgi:hypothetical protein